jgi:hypothetical protein
VATVCPFAGFPGVGRHGNGTRLRRQRLSFPDQWVKATGFKAKKWHQDALIN